jgi:Sensors of blue-light using FAD
MYELLYCSLASPNLATDDISDILQSSREWNSKHNITGCLLYYNNQFIQIIEGEKQMVKNLYATIEKDSRHQHIILLAENDKDERFFQNWSMAFNELSQSDMENIDKVLCVNNFITFIALDYKLTKATKMFSEMAKVPFRKLTDSP